MPSNLYAIAVRQIDGTQTTLKTYEGKVLLIVNVASKCGLTPQYDGLEKLYEEYGSKGFAVLGFPANEFAGQEPGTNADIQTFCRGTFGVQFPMFEKIVVKGEGQHPLYTLLTDAKPAADGKKDITWNFEKFLVSRSGEVRARFSPKTTPDDPKLVEAIKAELNS